MRRSRRTTVSCIFAPAPADAVRAQIREARSRPVRFGAGGRRAGGSGQRSGGRQAEQGSRSGAGREAPGEPRRAASPSSARSRHDRARGPELPVLPLADACDRRRCLGAAGRDPGAVPGAGDAPTQICVPRLRGGRGSGAGARAADQGRPAHRGDGRLRAGVQIRLASAALSAGPDAGRPGPRHQALDAGVLGRLRGRRTQAGL